MRKNLPVTDHEYVLAPDDYIVSKTDLKGKITYVNAGFVRISGFSEAELVGRPHNIVRHPSMPTEAFFDLWRSLKEGRPWTGLVKNRCKNGDFYWVMANVTPTRHDGRVTGYLSVRTAPDRASVMAAERIYTDVREGRARGIEIRDGAAVPVGIRAAMRHIRRVSLATRLGLVVGSQIAAVLLLAAVSLMSAHAVARWAVPSLGLIAAGLCVGNGMYVYQHLVRPLSAAGEAATAIAGGDLSHTYDSSGAGEVGHLLRAIGQMSVNVRSMVSDVIASVTSIDTAIRELAAGNDDLQTRTIAQGSRLSDTVSSMQALRATVRSNAVHATEAATLAGAATNVAERGGQAVDGVAHTMVEIIQSANRIGEISTVVNEIAFQTNILALNAAVEAAHAGEQGRGFGVVAAEVRMLAARSAGAAREIKTLVEDSLVHSGEGQHRVGEAGERTFEIVESAQRVASIVGEISLATAGQTERIEDIGRAVEQLDAITQQNVALVEEAAAVAVTMRQQSKQLVAAVGLFTLGGERR